MKVFSELKFNRFLPLAFSTLALPGVAHSFDFEVGDSTVSVYGYAKLDIIHDVGEDLGDNSVYRDSVALDGESVSEGHTKLHANQSRFGFKTKTPLSGDTLITNVEGDFYGNGGGALRLRHAYGEWNGILAGQTWTNFTALVAGTPVIDFSGSVGVPRVHRQGQIRYTHEKFSFSLEDPDTLGGQEDAIGAKSSAPDFVARYTNRDGRFKYSSSIVARLLEYDNAGAVGPSDSDSSFGWGVGLEASYAATQNITVRAGLTHGDGIGSYLNGISVSSPAYVADDGDLNTIEATGGVVGASLSVGPGDINASYSIASVDIDDVPHYGGDGTVDNPGLDKEYETAALNYIWSPADRITYGVEASWHSRETVDGFEGDAIRLQGMAMYSF